MLGVGLPEGAPAPAPAPVLGVEGVALGAAVPPPAAPDFSFSSFRHFSRSSPTMGAHLAGMAAGSGEGFAPGADGLVCASETLAIAKSAAAVAVLTSFNIVSFLREKGLRVTAAQATQRSCLA